MALAARDEGKKVTSDINVTPMVDVMLVLLIIFMVVTPMLNNKVNVNLAPAPASVLMENAVKEDAVVIAVTRDGKTFIGGDQVAPASLGDRITAKLEKKQDKQVFFRGDSRASYDAVETAIDAIRAAGVSNLGLLTDKPNSAGA